MEVGMTPDERLRAVYEAPNLRTAASLVNSYLLAPGHSYLLAQQLVTAFKVRCEWEKTADAVFLAKCRSCLEEVYRWRATVQTLDGPWEQREPGSPMQGTKFPRDREHQSPPLGGGEKNKGASRLPPGVPPAP